MPCLLLLLPLTEDRGSMSDKKFRTPYAVLRFPEGFQLNTTELEEMDGLWVDRSKVSEIDCYGYEMQGGGHIQFKPTDHYEARRLDGEYAEIFMAVSGKVLKRFTCQYSLGANEIRFAKVDVVNEAQDKVRRDLMDAIGDREIIFGPILTLVYAAEVIYEFSEEVTTDGGAEPGPGER